MVLLQNQDLLGNVERKRIRCYAIAPTKCTSLNLAIRYADVINSIVLQDDYLPRITAALEDVFKSLLWWAWKRCLYTAGHESENWELASAEEFQPVPCLCRCILDVYEDDLRNPIRAPPGGYHMNPDWKADVVLAIRGLYLGNQSDYAVLFDNKLGQTMFDGGYVHNGLLNAARWVFDAEHENQDFLGNVERKRIRCYAIALARCTSLNLAIRYANVIDSIVLHVETQAFL
ncbi:hypothetical protein Ancab_023337 [Ancistrocladus abbreviatus]